MTNETNNQTSTVDVGDLLRRIEKLEKTVKDNCIDITGLDVDLDSLRRDMENGHFKVIKY